MDCLVTVCVRFASLRGIDMNAGVEVESRRCHMEGVEA